MGSGCSVISLFLVGIRKVRVAERERMNEGGRAEQEREREREGSRGVLFYLNGLKASAGLPASFIGN